MSRSQRLCRLCEFPAADGGIPLDALDADKWDEWCRRELGQEFEIDTDAEQEACTLICKFCICEARLVHENSQDDCSFVNKTRCDWWTGHGDDHFYQHYYYEQPFIQPCKVVLEKISSDSGQDLLGTTSALLNASQISSQDKLEQKPYACPKKFEIGFNKKAAKKIFPCNFCKKFYTSNKNVSKHTNLVHKNTVKCKSRKCTCYFFTDIERRQHEEKVHLSKTSLKCKFCGALLLSGVGELTRHIKKVHKDAIKCDFDKRIRCPNYFHTEAEKDKHIFEVHNKVDFDPSQCIYCGKTFKYKDYLSMHIRNVHADIGIKCRFIGCSVYFFDRKESKDHFLKKHQHAQSLKKFKCPKCSFTTSTKHCWRNHMLRLHTKEATLKCPLCPRLFSAKKNLDQHLRAFHAERCTCEHCGMTMQKLSMQIHFLRKHAVYDFPIKLCVE